MEMNRKTRYTLLFTFIVIVILCFVSGYMLGHVQPSKLTYSSEINEVTDYLDKYYYEEYDKDEFVKGYLIKSKSISIVALLTLLDILLITTPPLIVTFLLNRLLENNKRMIS